MSGVMLPISHVYFFSSFIFIFAEVNSHVCSVITSFLHIRAMSLPADVYNLPLIMRPLFSYESFRGR